MIDGTIAKSERIASVAKLDEIGLKRWNICWKNSIKSSPNGFISDFGCSLNVNIEYDLVESVREMVY